MSTINVGYIEGPSTASNKIYIKSGSVLDITNSPDGAASIDLSVDAGDITGGTLAAARLPVGTVINSELFTNNTRTAFVGSSGTAFWSVSYTKKLADSIILVTSNVLMWSNSSGACGVYVEIDGTKYYSSGYTYEPNTYGHLLIGLAEKQVSTSGTKTISLGWLSVTGSGEKPAQYWNYNASDDGRNQQAVSTIHVIEVTV